MSDNPFVSLLQKEDDEESNPFSSLLKKEDPSLLEKLARSFGAGAIRAAELPLLASPLVSGGLALAKGELPSFAVRHTLEDVAKNVEAQVPGGTTMERIGEQIAGGLPAAAVNTGLQALGGPLATAGAGGYQAALSAYEQARQAGESPLSAGLGAGGEALVGAVAAPLAGAAALGKFAPQGAGLIRQLLTSGAIDAATGAGQTAATLGREALQGQEISDPVRQVLESAAANAAIGMAARGSTLALGPRSRVEPRPAPTPEGEAPRVQVTESVTQERRAQPDLREAVDHVLAQVRGLDDATLAQMMEDATIHEDLVTQKAIERVAYERSGQEAKRQERLTAEFRIAPKEPPSPVEKPRGESVFREASLSELMAVADPGMNMEAVDPVGLFVSKNPDLALGQGNNKGVKFEYELGGDLRYVPSNSKPTAGFSPETEEGFLRGYGPEGHTYRGFGRHLVRAIITPRAQVRPYWARWVNSTSKRLAEAGWNIQKVGENVVVEPPKSIVPSEVMPRIGEQPQRVLTAEQTPGEVTPPTAEPRELGSVFGNVAQELFGDQLGPLPEKTAPVKSLDQAVEERFSAARGIQVPGMKERVKEAAKNIVASFRRRDVNIDPNRSPEFARLADEFRVYDAASNAAVTNAADTIRSVTRDLTPNQGDLFGRILALRDIEKQGDLPFGYKDQAAVAADLAKFEAEASKPENTKIQDALAAREKMLENIKNQLVQANLLPEAVLQDPRYFHRMVMAYADTAAKPGAGRSSVRPGQKGFQKARTGSSADFNTSYHQAEFQFLSDALGLLEKKKTLDNIKGISDITPKLKAEAKAKFGDESRWRELVPDGYTLWQPARGNHFYPALTITEATLDKVLQGTKALEMGDVREALAMGGPKEQWAVPTELAAALDKRTKKTDAALERFWTAGQSSWKQWTLLNPTRALKYNLNNFSGDLDIVLASNPGILKYAPRAWADLWNYHAKKSSDPKLLAEMHDMQKRGVMESGWSAQEVPDISQEGVLRSMLETKSPNLAMKMVQKYWSGVKTFSSARENLLRVAAYRYFRDQIAQGKKRYGASTPGQVDAITDPSAKAAKLARELIGDYGNVSEAGQWLRRHMMPFYAWMEINSPRYVRLLRNVKEEGGSAAATSGRVAGVAAKKIAVGTAKLAVKANILFLLTQAWNRQMFPEEEKKLGEARREPHVILGRDDVTGEIKSIRFQGALADALDWFDLSDWPSDLAEVRAGKKTVKAVAAEAVKRPVEKTVQAFEPFTKTVYELASGRSMYPRMFKKGESFKVNPRVLFDRGEQVAKTFSVDRIYNRVMNKPRRPSDNVLIYRTDPGEAAYFETRSLVNDWLQKQDKEPVTGFEKNERQLALYYMKKAMQWKDPKRVIYWRKKFFDLGGTEDGMAKSIAKSAPLGAMSDDDQADFWDTLSPEDQDIVREAEQWYENRMAE